MGLVGFSVPSVCCDGTVPLLCAAVVVIAAVVYLASALKERLLTRVVSGEI